MRTVLALALCLAALPQAFAATGDYLDDRSDAAAVVKSLYNAINRKEYARAWSYFSTKPADSLEAYADGFSGTESVQLRVGRASEEGAAGSIHFSIPVAIEARGTDGSTSVFAGCYELKMANPEIATDDFTPLQIESGRFSAASGTLDEALPASCGDGPAGPPSDPLLERATALYEAALADTCMAIDETPAEEREPESFTIPFRYAFEGPDDPEHKVRLFKFLCNRGSYNVSHVFVFANEYDELRVISFATPELDIRYRNDDTEGPVEAIYVIGFRSAVELVNSDYDADTKTLHSFSKWRGVGDASSLGTWLFRSGEFSLVRFEVDATYDGEIDHQTVLDYATGP